VRGGVGKEVGILIGGPCCSVLAQSEPTVFRHNAIRTATWVLLATALLAQSETPTIRFHSMIPLGGEAYELHGEKWKGLITLLASAESSEFEGMTRTKVGKSDGLVSADGAPIRYYPGRVSFRVTASYRTRLIEPSPFPIGGGGDQNDYLLHLRFRVVAFHGLRQTVIEPDAVEMIGVPGEVAYDERIYRLSVNLSRVPLSDRVVLEIHDPEGGRICKFHLDLI